MAKHYHPQRDSRGKLVAIRKPTVATPLSTWSDPLTVACVVPGGPLPAKLNGIPFVPGSPAEGPDIDEPAFTGATGLKPAAGVVIEETVGRFWLVAPTNQVGGYAVTFPEGRPVPGASLQQTARCEAWEESGLVLELVAFLCDVPLTEFHPLLSGAAHGRHPERDGLGVAGGASGTACPFAHGGLPS